MITLLVLFFTIWVSPVPYHLAYQWERTYPAFQGLDSLSAQRDSVVYIVVLGAGFENDPEISITARLTSAVLSRLVEGIRVYKLLDSAKMVTSGGSFGRHITQARAVADVAVLLGIPPRDTLQLGQTYNTESEAKYFTERFGTGKTVILATSAMHIRRAMFWFSHFGQHPIAAPTNYRFKFSPEKNESWWKPSAVKFRIIDALMDEWVGLMWAKVKGW